MKGERTGQLELILRAHPEGLRKSEIARRMGVHRSTVGRYIEYLKTCQGMEISEENNLVKLSAPENDVQLSLSVYESLALNMGAEMLLKNSQYQNPYLASGLQKIAMNMQSHAPKIAGNILELADEIEKEAGRHNGSAVNTVFEVLTDAWASGRMVRIIHTRGGEEEETELAPYFIGFVESESGRSPITLTGRLRHTSEVVTLDIADIKSVVMLNETYTIPDNLRAFRKGEEPDGVSDVIDTIHLILKVRERSALNSFRALAHSEIKWEKLSDGTWCCSFEAENSIELILRIIQCFDSVEVLGPPKFRKRFVDILEQILRLYQNR